MHGQMISIKHIHLYNKSFLQQILYLKSGLEHVCWDTVKIRSVKRTQVASKSHTTTVRVEKKDSTRKVPYHLYKLKYLIPTIFERFRLSISVVDIWINWTNHSREWLMAKKQGNSWSKWLLAWKRMLPGDGHIVSEEVHKIDKHIFCHELLNLRTAITGIPLSRVLTDHIKTYTHKQLSSWQKYDHCNEW